MKNSKTLTWSEYLIQLDNEVETLESRRKDAFARRNAARDQITSAESSRERVGAQALFGAAVIEIEALANAIKTCRADISSTIKEVGKANREGSLFNLTFSAPSADDYVHRAERKANGQEEPEDPDQMKFGDDAGEDQDDQDEGEEDKGEEPAFRPSPGAGVAIEAVLKSAISDAAVKKLVAAGLDTMPKLAAFVETHKNRSASELVKQAKINKVQAADVVDEVQTWSSADHPLGVIGKNESVDPDTGEIKRGKA